VALAKTKRIKAVMINTNGVRLARDEEVVRRLSACKGNFEIHLQLDGFRQSTYEALRGLDLREVKRQAIANLTRYEIPSSMHGPVMLMKGGPVHERTEDAAQVEGLDIMRAKQLSQQNRSRRFV
jgi:hypothetical protein